MSYLNVLKEIIVNEEVKKTLEDQLTILLKKQNELLADLEYAEKKLIKEEKDVAKYEKFTFVNIFHTLAGNKYETLQKEEKEAMEAKTSYNTVLEKVTEVEKFIKQLQEKIKPYKHLATEKKYILQKIEESKIEVDTDIVVLAKLENQVMEIREAISVGETLLEKLNIALDHVDDADFWSTMDIVGGGFLSDIMKKSKLDDLDSFIKDLNKYIIIYNTELEDINSNISLSISSLESALFLDFIFDGFIFDFITKNKIGDIGSKLGSMKAKVVAIQNELNIEKNEIRNKISILRKQIF
ncbi:MAG: hypothetical protein ACK5LT_07595 [Lachnospirales bacterium]